MGRLKHPTQKDRLVRIPFEQFTKHWFLSGQTGGGKSSTAVQLVQSLIDQWLEHPNKSPGFTYFDPARETVAIILSCLLKAEREGKKVPWEKVHYFYLGPTDYPIGLNLLHRPEGVSPDSVARSAMHLIKYAYSNQDTPKMDRLLENALLTLLMDDRPHNLLGILPILANEEFRSRIVPQIDDPIIQCEGGLFGGSVGRLQVSGEPRHFFVWLCRS